MSATLMHHTDKTLLPDPARVIARLFLPGEELLHGRSRASAVVARVLALPEKDVELAAAQVVDEFSARHADLDHLIAENASTISSHLRNAMPMSKARRILVGASFTAEYAVEGAALCNPSAVIHPDQSGLLAGQARVALSLRAIGEGHLSSLGFCTAVVGADATWVFEPRALPVVVGTSHAATWSREHLRAVLADQGRINGLAHSVLAALPGTFSGTEFEHALADVHQDLIGRPGSAATLDELRHLVASTYEVSFPDGVAMSQQVLMPSSPDESNGLEDVRLVRFVDDDGAVEYRATYTAYDGRRIEPRFLTSTDLRTFHACRPTGPAARNKGMALFPRRIGGWHWSLCRPDGESNCVARSKDGLAWGKPQLIQAPKAAWEVLQVGNCGSPIETDRGWLVLTHGVGPMRTYRIGALLLDLEDPSRVIGELVEPLLQGTDRERDGYVPNVVYSCGGMIHDGRLWLPFGIGDARIGVAWAHVGEVLDAMRA